MTQQLSHVDDLRGLIAGPVIGPGDTDYDEARKVWNAAIDKHPAVIARCTSSKDVAAAVRFAIERDLEIAVRSGAHSMSGYSVVDDGVVIDLGPLNHVVVDTEAKRVRAGGGALLGDIDAAAQEHGLAVPAGMVSHTGVGGLVLGGGMGWLARRGGLSIDNVLAAEVVTADGQILRASADENPDLFWGIRGGGGNFGVVTEFEFRALEVGPMVHMGMLFWSLDQGADLLRMAREVIPTLPLEFNIVIVGMHAPPMPFVPEQHHGAPGFALVVVGFGDEATHAELLGRIRTQLPPTWEFATPMPFTALQQMLDEPNQWGQYDYDKGLYVEEISDELIDVVVAQQAKKQSPLSVLLFYRLDHAYSAVVEDDTAFSGGRSPRYSMFIIAVCPTRELYEADRTWARGMYEAALPHAADTAVYINALTDLDEGQVKTAYGPEKYARLAKLKAKYDPDNVFHRNGNIRPAKG